ncbi:hypothetical protein [Halostella litorea]|uniref:hypothetical protein n=1 Tax=Halostella litorea TaxID=2528831 RepID=UPI00109258D0|nr:hypothetical protein [Halostella litorea]
MSHQDSNTDDEHAAPAEDLDAETLRNIAASDADTKDAIKQHIPTHTTILAPVADDGDVREAYRNIDLYAIDDEAIVGALYIAADEANCYAVRLAAERRLDELEDDLEPLAEPDHETDEWDGDTTGYGVETETVEVEVAEDDTEAEIPVTYGDGDDTDDQPRDDENGSPEVESEDLAAALRAAYDAHSYRQTRSTQNYDKMSAAAKQALQDRDAYTDELFLKVDDTISAAVYAGEIEPSDLEDVEVVGDTTTTEASHDVAFETADETGNSECINCGDGYDSDHNSPYLCGDCREQAAETGGLGAEIRSPDGADEASDRQ